MLSKIIILVRLQNNRQRISEINSRKIPYPSIKIYLQYNKNYRKYKEKEKD